MQETSAFQPFTLSVPDAPVSHQGVALQLDTSAEPTLSTPTSNAALMPTSAQASGLSSSSSAYHPPPARQEESEQSQAQRRRQRASEHRATPRTKLPRANRDAWDNYFRDQEAWGIVYERDEPSSSSRPLATALQPCAMTNEVGFAKPPSNFRVLNLQAQHMIIHDSSSGQLVEATVPSIDFSQLAALRNLLQLQPSQSQGPPRAWDDSPPRCPE
jgi:hypothetical protein